MDFEVMEISESAYAPLPLMLFSVLAVIGGWPENTFMLLCIKKTSGPFFQPEKTTKKGKKKFSSRILL